MRWIIIQKVWFNSDKFLERNLRLIMTWKKKTSHRYNQFTRKLRSTNRRRYQKSCCYKNPTELAPVSKKKKAWKTELFIFKSWVSSSRCAGNPENQDSQPIEPEWKFESSEKKIVRNSKTTESLYGINWNPNRNYQELGSWIWAFDKCYSFQLWESDNRNIQFVNTRTSLAHVI